MPGADVGQLVLASVQQPVARADDVGRAVVQLADELVGGVLSAGPDRLEAVGHSGIPQVVSLGALDMVNFGPRDTVPEKFADRTLYVHNPTITLMRTTPEESVEAP